MAKQTIPGRADIGTIANNDLLLIHDTSEAADRKVTVEDLIGGTIRRGTVKDLALLGGSDSVDNNWLGLFTGWTSCLIRIYKWSALDNEAEDLLERMSPYGAGLSECLNIGADDPWLDASGYWPLKFITSQNNWYNTSSLQWKMLPLSNGLNFKNITNSGNETISFSFIAW
ncbi:MAG: hypothetical protein COA69_09345 [Robiginitomaculum sp.]|nr:MAG: hypothetical protein COA69_09345 [Robiginitomaculum sp.]